MEERLGGRESHCPVCRASVEPEFLICPVCTTKLRQACATCKQPLEPLWQVCPYCETPIVRRTPVLEDTMALSTEELHEPLRTPRRRRRSVAEDTAEGLTGDQ
jgi:predicted amidophosphoribosyltransferase